MKKISSLISCIFFAIGCLLVLLGLFITRPIVIGLRYLNHRQKKQLIKEIQKTAQEEFGILITTTRMQASRLYDFQVNNRRVVVVQSLINQTAIEEDFAEARTEEYVVIPKTALLDLCEHETVDLRFY